MCFVCVVGDGLGGDVVGFVGDLCGWLLVGVGVFGWVG